MLIKNFKKWQKDQNKSRYINKIKKIIKYITNIDIINNILIYLVKNTLISKILFPLYFD